MTDHRVAQVSFSDGFVECRCGAVIRDANLHDAFNSHRAAHKLPIRTISQYLHREGETNVWRQGYKRSWASR